MSVTLNDTIELLIRENRTVEKCYTEITTFWPDNQQIESATRQSLTAAGGGTPTERYWVVS